MKTLARRQDALLKGSSHFESDREENGGSKDCPIKSKYQIKVKLIMSLIKIQLAQTQALPVLWPRISALRVSLSKVSESIIGFFKYCRCLNFYLSESFCRGTSCRLLSLVACFSGAIWMRSYESSFFDFSTVAKKRAVSSSLGLTVLSL